MDDKISSKAQAGPKSAEIAKGLPPTYQAALPLFNIRASEPTFMEVFFAWEKLRLLYNSMLIVAVLGTALKAGYSMLVGIFFVEPAIYANLCFCAGPVAEGYLTWLGLPRRPCRWIIFWVGFFITLTFAIIYTPIFCALLDR
jgi:hypothetical protein